MDDDIPEDELPEVDQAGINYFMSLDPWLQRTDEFDNITIHE